MAGTYRRETAEFDRSLSFFDAVFGFAVTLLITNLDVPPREAWSSLSTLLDHGVGTQVLGFLISFVVIVAFWRSNQNLIARLRGLDARAITWNVALAGLIVFIPFTTQGISDPELADLPLPVVLYAVNVAAAILVHAAMYEGALRRGLARVPVPARVRRAEQVDVLLKPLVFLISIPIALTWGGRAGTLTWLSLVVIGPVSGRWVVRRRAEQGEAHLDASS